MADSVPEQMENMLRGAFGAAVEEAASIPGPPLKPDLGSRLAGYPMNADDLPKVCRGTLSDLSAGCKCGHVRYVHAYAPSLGIHGCWAGVCAVADCECSWFVLTRPGFEVSHPFTPAYITERPS